MLGDGDVEIAQESPQIYAQTAGAEGEYLTAKLGTAFGQLVADRIAQGGDDVVKAQGLSSGWVYFSEFSRFWCGAQGGWVFYYKKNSSIFFLTI